MPESIQIYFLHLIAFIVIIALGKSKWEMPEFIKGNNISVLSSIICLLSLLTTIIYYVPFKWLLKWHTDPWILEVLFVLWTFVSCDILFFILLKHWKELNHSKLLNIITKAKKAYRMLRVAIVLWFGAKIVLFYFFAFIPYGAITAYSILPDIRGIDHQIHEQYYLDYNTKNEQMLVTRKVGPFEKDFPILPCGLTNEARSHLDKRYMDIYKTNNEIIFPAECFIQRGDTTFLSSNSNAEKSKIECHNCGWAICEYCHDYNAAFRKRSVSYYKVEDKLIIQCNVQDYGSAFRMSGRPNRYVGYQQVIDLLNNDFKSIIY